jgi:hypothetical protein
MAYLFSVGDRVSVESYGRVRHGHVISVGAYAGVPTVLFDNDGLKPRKYPCTGAKPAEAGQ